MDKIYTYPQDNDLLHQISKETTLEEINKLDLINRLKTSLELSLKGGVGLSAIQIGIPLRVALVKYQGKEEVLINPEIVFGLGNRVIEEGCLSVPNERRRLNRYVEIEYISNCKKKKAKGIKAIIIQHELDHMNGKLIIDKRD